MLVSFLVTACQKAKEPDAKKSGTLENKEVKQSPVGEEQPHMLEQGRATQPESTITAVLPGQSKPETVSPSSKKTVPLITEVMTKEELQAYLKEIGIPIIKKEDFKGPELVWEKTFDEPIQSIKSISDLTEKGSCIIATGSENLPQRNLLFLDSNGDIKKKIAVRNKAFAVANGGYAAILAEWKEQAGLITIAYYNEEGKEVWKKEIRLRTFEKILISDNGETTGIQEGSPRWSDEEWQAGNLNESRIVFLDKKGDQLFEFKSFRNIGWGEFSRDGNYYAGIFWWQEDNPEGMKTWGKLIYINAKDGKILWEKPFGGNWWKWGEQFGEGSYLAVSEEGSYIAAVDLEPAEKAPKEADPFDSFEVDVFDRDGKLTSRVRDARVYRVTENGLVFTGARKRKQLADVLMHKFILKSDFKAKSAYGPDPRHPEYKTLLIMEQDEWIEDINFGKYIIYSTVIHEGKGLNRFKNFKGELLYEGSVGGIFTLDGNYIKNGVSMFKIQGGHR